MNDLNTETQKTRCGECGEPLENEPVTDQRVYDFDGTLDYISLFHQRCRAQECDEKWCSDLATWNGTAGSYCDLDAIQHGAPIPV